MSKPVRKTRDIRRHVMGHSLLVLGCAIVSLAPTAITLAQQTDLRDVFYSSGESKTTSMVGKVSVVLVEPANSREVRVDHGFASGDRFRFVVSTNKRGWLYILHSSPSGKSKQLWPNPGLHTRGMQGQEVMPGMKYEIPPKPGTFIFKEDVGLEEFIIAIRSRQQAPDLSLTQGSPAAQDTDSLNKSGNKTTGNIIIRGDPFGGENTRSAFFDPGTQDSDTGLYFTEATGNDGTNAIVRFRLRHNQ